MKTIAAMFVLPGEERLRVGVVRMQRFISGHASARATKSRSPKPKNP
jgi:hypothetical protein